MTRIPNTLLVSAISIVPDTNRCVTMELKQAGSAIWLVGGGRGGGSLQDRIARHRKMAALIRAGKVRACHDVSDGGWATAAAEMAIGSQLGLELDPAHLDGAFDEIIGAYLVEVAAGENLSADAGLPARKVATVIAEPEIRLGKERAPVADLAAAWMGTLDW